mgnify:FL=1
MLGPDLDGSAVDGRGADGPAGDALGLDGPPVDEPGPDTSADQLLDAEVPKRLRREFLLQAGGLNLGLLSTASGALVLGFTGALRMGIGLVLLGAVLLAITAWRYVHHAP